MVSSTTLDDMCSPFWRLRSAAWGGLVRRASAVVMSSVGLVSDMLDVVDIASVCGLSFGTRSGFVMISSVFHLGLFCGGDPAAHKVQSRLRANVSARAFTHVFVCMFSVSSVLILIPERWFLLCRRRCNLSSFSFCLSGVLLLSVHAPCE